jgi:hypothetical protein
MMNPNASVRVEHILCRIIYPTHPHGAFYPTNEEGDYQKLRMAHRQI